MNTETDKKPGLVQLAYRYTRALSRWIKAGRPVRDEAEIKRIFETSCHLCEAYDTKIHPVSIVVVGSVSLKRHHLTKSLRVRKRVQLVSGPNERAHKRQENGYEKTCNIKTVAKIFLAEPVTEIAKQRGRSIFLSGGQC